MGNCNRCQAEITWPVPFVKGNKPLNPDGSQHFCKAEKKEEYKSPNQSLFDTVKWDIIPEDEKTSDMLELVIGLKTMRALAYQDAKDIHPDMPENSNTFGQIVNAGISHLINLAKVKAMKTRSK